MTENERLELKAQLQASPLYFTQYFYRARTGKDFIISSPMSRRPHQLIIFEELYKVFTGETKRLIINIPPRYGKTISVIHFIAWALSIYPDCNFIYTSYALSLAKKQTQTIRDILSLHQYGKLFGIGVNSNSSAKSDFETTHGGSIFAAGTGGPITGRGAGIRGIDRFGGAVIIDDSIKPDEATSDTIREGINEWFYNTLQSRLNGPEVPIVSIGQCVHEADLNALLKSAGDWRVVSLAALDELGNALDPDIHSVKSLLKMKEENPYVFAAQYQQNPQPAGGGLFKPENFHLMDEFPGNIISSFITVDTAESTSDYADYTVFSFWALYKISHGNHVTDELGLHWVGCVQDRIEPKDLKLMLMEFYSECMKYPCKPKLIAIEKKSSGSTLLSVLSDLRGIQTRSIERTKASGNKTARFLEMQPYIARKLISLPRYGKHTQMCIEHMRKITTNDSHRHDDICDTVYDAIKIALIDKSLDFFSKNDHNSDDVAARILGAHKKVINLKNNAYRG